MTDLDSAVSRVAQAVELGQRGDLRAARYALEQLWVEIGGGRGDPLDRCAIAHALADLQNDAGSELTWDLKALAAANFITDARAEHAGLAIAVAGLYPSLHLNVGDCYRRLGDLRRAREHATLGKAALDALDDGGYEAHVSRGLDRLIRRIDREYAGRSA